MKIGLMFRDIFGSLFHRPATEKYPFERQAAPERLRSYLQLDTEKCTGCGLCVMDCPAGAIEVDIIDRKEKRFTFTYHVDQCIFCGQCVATCHQDSLSMDSDHWELASLDRSPFTVVLREVDDGKKELAGKPADVPETPAKS
jgi:formate hydrogenlyase subunit 6/NADH:ubiquinone oxidoreductase subunit I